MLPDDYENFHSGFVGVVGRPNAGKSSLMNALLRRKVAAVSPWPQTTRKRQMGILTRPDAQIIFVDTPGVHKPLHKLGEKMNKEAEGALEEVDLVLVIMDASQPPNDEDRLLAEMLHNLKRRIPVLVTLNKIDLIEEGEIPGREQAYQEILPGLDTITISATRGDNLEALVEAIASRLPEGPPFFPEDQITDIYERDIAADLIRESVLNNIRAEVPHSVAVRIDEYKEKDEQGAFIAATLFVERESQVGILIGQGGSMLKKIGTEARQEIERVSGRKVFLQLRVKVRKNWRNDEAALRLFGFGK